MGSPLVSRWKNGSFLLWDRLQQVPAESDARLDDEGGVLLNCSYRPDQEPCAHVGPGTEQALKRRQRPGGHTARNLVRLQESELRGKLGGVDSKQEPVDVEGVLGELFLTAYIPILQAFPYLVHFRHQ